MDFILAVQLQFGHANLDDEPRRAGTIVATRRATEWIMMSSAHEAMVVPAEAVAPRSEHAKTLV